MTVGQQQKAEKAKSQKQIPACDKQASPPFATSLALACRGQQRDRLRDDKAGEAEASFGGRKGVEPSRSKKDAALMGAATKKRDGEKVAPSRRHKKGTIYRAPTGRGGEQAGMSVPHKGKSTGKSACATKGKCFQRGKKSVIEKGTAEEGLGVRE